MKKILLFSLLLFTHVLSAQTMEFTKVDDNKKENLIRKISKSFTSFGCDFKELKYITILDETITSEGKIYYKSPDKLFCKYCFPKEISIVVFGKEIIIKTPDGNQNPNDFYYEKISTLLDVIGGKSYKQFDKYNLEVFYNSIQYLVVITPTNKPERLFFNKISIYFNSSSNTIDKIIMLDSSDDVITMTFHNQAKNIRIDDSIFK